MAVAAAGPARRAGAGVARSGDRGRVAGRSRSAATVHRSTPSELDAYVERGDSRCRRSRPSRRRKGREVEEDVRPVIRRCRAPTTTNPVSLEMELTTQPRSAKPGEMLAGDRASNRPHRTGSSRPGTANPSMDRARRHAVGTAGCRHAPACAGGARVMREGIDVRSSDRPETGRTDRITHAVRAEPASGAAPEPDGDRGEADAALDRRAGADRRSAADRDRRRTDRPAARGSARADGGRKKRPAPRLARRTRAQEARYRRTRRRADDDTARRSTTARSMSAARTGPTPTPTAGSPSDDIGDEAREDAGLAPPAQRPPTSRDAAPATRPARRQAPGRRQPARAGATARPAGRPRRPTARTRPKKRRRRRGGRGRSKAAAAADRPAGDRSRSGNASPAARQQAGRAAAPAYVDAGVAAQRRRRRRHRACSSRSTSETLERRRGTHRKGRPGGPLPDGRARARRRHRAHRGARGPHARRALRRRMPTDDTLVDRRQHLPRAACRTCCPGMEAAFIDIGTPKNGVLYRGDVVLRPGRRRGQGQRPRIEQRAAQRPVDHRAGHEEPDRAQGRAPHAGGEPRRPLRRDGARPAADVRHLEAAARRRAQAPAPDARQAAARPTPASSCAPRPKARPKTSSSATCAASTRSGGRSPRSPSRRSPAACSTRSRRSRPG